ncbi:MAG: hypothetical protein ACI4U6_04905 [Acutalibacteraceae bacterium]
MKDIFEILKENGIEVEEGKQKDIRRSLNENYIAVNEHTKKINALTEQVNTANNTVTDLKGKLDEAEKLGVSDKRWSRYVEMVADVRYIKGARIIKYVTNGTNIKSDKFK